MGIKKVLPLIPGILIAVLLLALISIRVDEVNRNIGSYIACEGCFDSVVFLNDLVLCYLVFGLLLLAGFLKPVWVARIVQMFAAAVILIYVADLIVFQLFHTRMFMTDAALFMRERAAVWDQFYSGVGGLLNASLILTGVLVLFIGLFLLRPARQRSSRILLSALIGLSLLLTVFLDQDPYVNSWAVDNVFSANLSTSARNMYSKEFAAEIPLDTQAESVPNEVKNAGPADGHNVIVVIMESWSSWHSELFGGYENWTPHLDSAALRGRRYTNFHAIGFATAHGLMGILGGAHLWSPFMHWYGANAFYSMWGKRETLPATFRSHGYSTAFLTTGPLKLYYKGEWLTDIGFQYVEGQELGFYEGQPTFAFNAASDQALYQRAEQWRREASEPYLLVLETVTTHQPYVDPDTGELSLERSMKYADRQFGTWLESLDQSGFFENGLLVVVSDHRSMTPIPAEEFKRFGDQAYSRVPMFVIGKEVPSDQVDDVPYSQGDLVPSFNGWLSGYTPPLANDAVMFMKESEKAVAIKSGREKCAFHNRGNQPDLVDINCISGVGLVLLDGDQTRFLSSQGLDIQLQDSILLEIAAERLEALKRHQVQSGPLPKKD